MKKAILVLPALLAACSSSFTKTNETFQQQFDAGQYAAAAKSPHSSQGAFFNGFLP